MTVLLVDYAETGFAGNIGTAVTHRDHHQMGSFVSVQRSDGSVEYQCPQCPYKTTWRGNIRLHQVTHSDQCPFICPQCFKGFKRNHHLKRHLLQVHMQDGDIPSSGPPEVKKEDAGGSACAAGSHSSATPPTSASLGEAQRAAAASAWPQHDGMCCSRRRCPFCSKPFLTKWHLQRHVRIHTGIHHQDDASLTVDKGNGSKEYMCPLCPYTTSRRGNVRLHLIRHSDRHPFLCPVCSKAFKRSYDLKRHLRHLQTHTNEWPYKCPYCPKAYFEKIASSPTCGATRVTSLTSASSAT
ncbi:zinc finger protein 425-like [Rhipicephalus sanguineus]|uniref:zinc finger protein 425-like n=1 Tax=Rhipicephalus sanguineus TaxID=34632 RepID=UPI0020C2947D|nr:zinc finger protein 425-like [Rhipicephalus sanguineus]